MANVVEIIWSDTSMQGLIPTPEEEFGTKLSVTYPLLEDVKITAKSSFGENGDKYPGIVKGFLDTAQDLATTSELSGRASTLKTSFQMFTWTKTDPLKLQVSFILYARKDPLVDVVRRSLSLTNLAIITPIRDKFGGRIKGFLTPGWNTKDAKAVAESLNPATLGIPSLQQDSKIVSVRIPGIINMPAAAVESADPTFSKEKTIRGYPLYCKMDMTFSSLAIANSDMLELEFGEQRAADARAIEAAGLATLG